MKTIKILGLSLGLFLMVLTVYALPTVAGAASYGYINESGNLVYVDANTAAGAFTNSTNIANHSGVILVDNVDQSYTNNQEYSGYVYVNESGVATQVDAHTSAGAFTNSVNIAEHSGVMLINSVSDSNVVGNDVAGF